MPHPLTTTTASPLGSAVGPAGLLLELYYLIVDVICAPDPPQCAPRRIINHRDAARFEEVESATSNDLATHQRHPGRLRPRFASSFLHVLPPLPDLLAESPTVSNLATTSPVLFATGRSALEGSILRQYSPSVALSSRPCPAASLSLPSSTSPRLRLHAPKKGLASLFALLRSEPMPVVYAVQRHFPAMTARGRCDEARQAGLQSTSLSAGENERVLAATRSNGRLRRWKSGANYDMRDRSQRCSPSFLSLFTPRPIHFS